jgi:alkanesulfonate monooxygenase SsuD/methylene tetrahydromethanopterin reductase-like flavin-dependent oxidoreductase (luciferase family)
VGGAETCGPRSFSILTSLVTSLPQYDTVLPRSRNACLALSVGGYALVGTAELIAERLGALSAAGVGEVLLTWLDYSDGMERFNRDVVPLFRQARLRV